MPGAILGVPVTIALTIVAAHVGRLRPLAPVLSSETEIDGLDRLASRS